VKRVLQHELFATTAQLHAAALNGLAQHQR
jgi:hypothetical protein